MINLILNAIPFFLLSVVVEFLSLRRARRRPAEDPADAPVGYELRDTRTSLTMGVGHVVIYSGWKLVMLAAYAGLYLLTPLRLDPGDWWIWVLLFFCRRPLLLRLPPRPPPGPPVLGDPRRPPQLPALQPLDRAAPGLDAVLVDLLLGAAAAARLPAVDDLPGDLLEPALPVLDPHREDPPAARLVEAVFNTPTHHRVHHGSNEQYLDKNYGGILIVWDRLFGTFEPERERVRYGLTTNIETFNPLRVAFHEYVAIWRDVRAAHDLARAPRLHVQGTRLGPWRSRSTSPRTRGGRRRNRTRSGGFRRSHLSSTRAPRGEKGTRTTSAQPAQSASRPSTTLAPDCQ